MVIFLFVARDATGLFVNLKFSKPKMYAFKKELTDKGYPFVVVRGVGSSPSLDRAAGEAFKQIEVKIQGDPNMFDPLLKSKQEEEILMRKIREVLA